MMNSVFLTGATGLLGSYLIRDLLAKGGRIAILARRTRLETVVQRVENLVARWEKQAGYSLPRPVVFEGSLSEPGLGLATEDVRWIAENCSSVLHNAASLTFHAESAEGEPWRSNLHGTRHLLEFTRQVGITEFHHVSTAYVCGLRQDLVREDDLDVGQQHGNDYEVSKFQSEQMVRNAEHLKSVTVYRPAIILGDHQTGYTTTYHGFYVPLKLVSTLLSRSAIPGMTREEMAEIIGMVSERLREILHLKGHEHKNLVPVDWCSQVMAEIFFRPELHGKTYHLTPVNKTSVRLIQDVMAEVFLEKMDHNSKLTPDTVNWDMFEKTFVSGMEVYQSYWKDDPTFDQTNLREALPHLLCPEMDRAALRRMCLYALENNFGWPRIIPDRPEFDLHARLKLVEGRLVSPQLSQTAGQGKTPVHLGLQVNGPGGGEWELVLDEGRLSSTRPCLSPRCQASYYLNMATFRRLAFSKTTAQKAIETGRVLVQGDGYSLDDLAETLQKVAIATGESETSSSAE